jgi:hypothetical protein
MPSLSPSPTAGSEPSPQIHPTFAQQEHKLEAEAKRGPRWLGLGQGCLPRCLSSQAEGLLRFPGRLLRLLLLDALSAKLA